ncbi:MAG TPA: DUF4926 domain-containing protein [Phycisphaerae bacterium]
MAHSTNGLLALSLQIRRDPPTGRAVGSVAIPTEPMVFELYSGVTLTPDLPNHDSGAGDVATVVERHRLPGREDGYSVELFDMTGRTLALVTLSASRLRAPAPADPGQAAVPDDRPSVRATAHLK